MTTTFPAPKRLYACPLCRTLDDVGCHHVHGHSPAVRPGEVRVLNNSLVVEVDRQLGLAMINTAPTVTVLTTRLGLPLIQRW